MSVNEKMTAVADAIREKTGGTEKLTLDDMPGQIGSIKSYSEGYEQGKVDGVENLPVGYLKVDPNWTDLGYLCRLRPSMVASLKYSDTANGTNFANMFNQCYAVSIPSLDFRKAKDLNNLFIYSGTIEEIGEMDIPNVTNFYNAFRNCYGLKRISFVKGCIKCSVSFSSCNLLEDSAIQSIIDGLADLTGQTAQTIGFHTDVLLKLTTVQTDAITAKNWTIL